MFLLVSIATTHCVFGWFRYRDANTVRSSPLDDTLATVLQWLYREQQNSTNTLFCFVLREKTDSRQNLRPTTGVSVPARPVCNQASISQLRPTTGVSVTARPVCIQASISQLRPTTGVPVTASHVCNQASISQWRPTTGVPVTARHVCNQASISQSR